MKLTGTVTPLHDKVIIADMNFGDEQTESGLIIQSTNAKGTGVVPRWARVWAVGPEQQDVKVGEWILIEHARWTRTIEYENEDGSITELRMADLDAIMLAADEKPSGVMISVSHGAGSNVNFNIPG
jgi:co-chaperonin GroES (HSP10)